MQEETSFQVSPFLSMSQCSKTFESSWEIRPKIPALVQLAVWGKSGHLGYFWPPLLFGPLGPNKGIPLQALCDNYVPQ